MSPTGPDPGDPFAGDGEIRALARATDWSSRSLGAVKTWSPTLRSTVRSCLDSPFPISLWCGTKLVLIYNDAYRHVLGDKHPESFARPGDEVWSEIWDDIAPMFEQIGSGGPPIYADDAPFHIERTNGEEERHRTSEPNAWFTFALSGVRSEEGQTEQRFVDFVYYPITGADANRAGVVAHGSDVTAHVRAREDAHAARKEAEEANQAKSRFLASMSHELRTPINAILGYTELLEMGIPGPVNDAQKVQLERVRNSSRHLLMLIDDILDLTKVEAGRLKVREDRLPVKETVSAALSLVTPQAGDRDIRIEAPPPSGPSPTFVGDEDRVRQILVNLLSNAVKFTEPGGTIRITHGTSDAPPSDPGAAPMTYIAVADTGIGIEPEEIEGLFEPFTQGEADETRGRGGTGLGLAISRKLAELMGGRLTAESEPGEGSTFTVWLPDRETSPAKR